MDVASVLLAAQSPDHLVRTGAENVLKEAQESNFSVYLTTLSDHLSSNDNNPESRRLAGLIVKNAFHSRDPALRAAYVERWITLVDNPSKAHVRRALFNTLSSPHPEPRRAAAQVIAKIAAIDLPRPPAWDSLIPDLLSLLTPPNPQTHQPHHDDHVKQAALEVLGYICEEAVFGDAIDAVLSKHSNHILTAVVQGINYAGSPTSTDHSILDVRLAATIALNNTLEFARSQFEVPAERTAILNTLCNAAKSSHQSVRQVAFEGLVKVAEHYYDKLHEYIGDIYALTENAIRNDVEQVAMQAIEFWSTVAEEECNINFEYEAAADSAKPHQPKSKQFVVHALPFLSGPIFDSLKKQEDDPLEDASWNTATAAGACIELLASAAPETILDLVKPFVESNIRDHANWRSREAAILAFGAVLEGPPPSAVRSLVKDAMQVLIDTLLTDPNLSVKDTTAWTLARAVVADRETTLAHLRVLVECLRRTLSVAENPLFASHICYAIHNIADSFANEATHETGPLTEHMEPLMQALVSTADRVDGGESNLRIGAYESMSALFRSVPRDALELVKAWMPRLLEKLQVTLQSFSHALGEDDIQNLSEQQGLICGTLTTATHRLSKEEVLPFADQLMHVYLGTLNVGSNGGSVEDSFLAIGALADSIGSDFKRYMDHVMPMLQKGLSNDVQWQLCGVAVGVTGEVSRALGEELTPYAEKLVYLLLEAVKSTQLDRSVKPSILTCFGDIAMSVKGGFEPFLKPVMDCMKQAAESSVSLPVNGEDFDTIDWVQTLQESVLEAYVGIVSGLRDDGKEKALMPYVEWVLSFCEVVLERSSGGGGGAGGGMGGMPEELLKPMLALMGDLGEAIPQFKEVVKTKAWLQGVVTQGRMSEDGRLREVTQWVVDVVLNR